MPTGKSRKRGAAGAAQQPLEQVNLLPLFKKPFEKIGKQVEIRGDYWQLAKGRMTEEEKNTLYKCTIKDF